jgi:hypothetical protein
VRRAVDEDERERETRVDGAVAEPRHHLLDELRHSLIPEVRLPHAFVLAQFRAGTF